MLARAAAGLSDGTIASDVVMRPAGVPCRLSLGRAARRGWTESRIDERALPSVAARVDITERSAHGIITDLTAAGYLVKQKDGRRNRYQIQAHLPLPEPASRERTVGEVLALLTGNDRPGIELPLASDANGRRATQAKLKTPLMPGRQADGGGSTVPDPRAEGPDAARAGDPAR